MPRNRGKKARAHAASVRAMHVAREHREWLAVNDTGMAPMGVSARDAAGMSISGSAEELTEEFARATATKRYVADTKVLTHGLETPEPLDRATARNRSRALYDATCDREEYKDAHVRGKTACRTVRPTDAYLRNGKVHVNETRPTKFSQG